MNDLKDALERLRTTHNLPALGAISIVDGKRTEPLVVGQRRLGGTDPARPDDRFHLGSDTKAMTAALIGVLIDQKVLALTTTVGALFPKVAAPWQSVTLQELLWHRAGLARIEPAGKTLNELRRLSPSPQAARESWINTRFSEQPDKTQGHFAYSNAGYTLLGALAERAAHVPYETLLAERVWKPLGITTGGFGAPPQLYQHRREGSKTTPFAPAEQVDNPPLMSPAGRAYLSLSDWARFVAVFAAPTKQTLLTQTTLAALLAHPPGGDYAGGWIQVERPWAGGIARTHAGSNTLNYCNAWVAPQRRFAALVATNIGFDAVAAICDSAIGLVVQHVLGK